jgi:hypothetical protein
LLFFIKPDTRFFSLKPINIGYPVIAFPKQSAGFTPFPHPKKTQKAIVNDCWILLKKSKSMFLFLFVVPFPVTMIPLQNRYSHK